MNRTDLIRIGLAIAVILWLSIATIPVKLAILHDVAGHYYDDLMTSQAFLLRKQKEKLSKAKYVPEEAKLDSDEILAKNLWASFRAPAALQLLLEIKSKREKMNKAYNQKMMNVLLLLAEVSRDLNKLQDSANYYEQIQKLDEHNLLLDDPRLMRDQTNLAMIAYLRGDVEADEKKRKKYFQDCLEHVKGALILWHAEKDPDPAVLPNLFFLKYVACRESGDEVASKQAYGEMKYLEKKLKRPVIPPRT